MSMERQELYCHECSSYVQFDVDVEMNGNHVIKCPKCGHEHCRVVENGIITSDRWDSRNSFQTIINYVSNITWTQNSTYTTYTQFNNVTSNITTSNTNDWQFFAYQSWSNAGQHGTNSSGNNYTYTITYDNTIA